MENKLKITSKKFTNLSYVLPISLTSYLFFKQKFPWLPGYSCPIRHATGVPCPSCFLTRSICASLGGDFLNAFKIHLFGPPLAALLIIWSILSLKRKKILRINFKSKFLFIGFSFFLIYWIYRLMMYFILGVEVFPDF
tara:strand:- start:498 stop:911 length:414 start_codon:yes stop_codon:yes gene_type:complete